MLKEIIPVLHVLSEIQVIENLDILKKLDLNKVFIIGHSGKYTVAENLITILKIAKEKSFWCGCNFLNYDPIEILKTYNTCGFDALWYDDSYAGINNNKTKEIFDTRNIYNENIELYGGVAFKYCQQPKSLDEACIEASKYMDVVVTSSLSTGVAANINKVNDMRNYTDKNKRLGIASGITPENVNDYNADIFLVSTGVSKDFYNFDEKKLSQLIKKIN